MNAQQQQEQIEIRKDVNTLINHLREQGVTHNTTEEEMEGLGDLLEKGLTTVGLTEERFKQLFGLKECNCSARKKWLNNVLSWKKKQIEKG